MLIRCLGVFNFDMASPREDSDCVDLNGSSPTVDYEDLI